MKQCGHFRSVEGKAGQEFNRRLDHLFATVARSRIIDEPFFWRTHEPIRLFRLVQGREEGLDEVTEKDVLEDVVHQRTGNHTSVILGKAGIGKSELCAYLFLSLRGEVPAGNILYFDRSVRLPDIIHVLDERHRELSQTGIPGNNPTKIEELRQSPNVFSHKFVTEILSHLGLASAFEGEEAATESFRRFTSERIRALLENTGVSTAPQERNFVEPGMLTLLPHTNWASKILSHYKNETAASRAINEAFVYGLRSITNTLDIKMALLALSSLVEGRLYIIFEDYALSDLESEELRNFMESDNQSFRCEFVVAGIPDNLSVLTKQTGLERHRFYQFAGQGRECLFLSPETAGTFLGRYLSYWKDELNPQDCAVCSSLKGETKTLFPFNPAFVSNLYNGLINERPRGIVGAAHELLRDYSRGIPPLKSNSLLKHARFRRNFSYDEYNELEKLVSWYGDINPEGSVVLEKKFVELFGVSSGSSNVADAKDHVVFVPQTGTLGPVGSGGDTSILSGLGRNVEELKVVPNWQVHPDLEEYRNVGNLIVNGANRALAHLSSSWRITGDWAQLDGPPIKYDYQTDFAVGLPGSLADVSFNPRDYTVLDLSVLLLLGKRQGALPAELLSRLPPEIVLARDRWRETKWIELLNTEPGQGSWMKFKDVILRIARLILLIQNPFIKLDLPDIERIFGTWRNSEGEKADGLSLAVLAEESGLDSSTHRDVFSFLLDTRPLAETILRFLQAAYTHDGTALRLDGESSDWMELDPVPALSGAEFRRLIRRIGQRYKVLVDGRDYALADFLKQIGSIAKRVEEQLSHDPETEEGFRQDATALQDWLRDMDLGRLRRLTDRLVAIRSPAMKKLADILRAFLEDLKRTDLENLEKMLSLSLDDQECLEWVHVIRANIVASLPVFERARELRSSDLFNAEETGDKSARDQLAEEALQGLKEALRYV